MGMRGYAKPVECKCEHNFTCRVCLMEAVPRGLPQGTYKIDPEEGTE